MKPLFPPVSFLAAFELLLFFLDKEYLLIYREDTNTSSLCNNVMPKWHKGCTQSKKKEKEIQKKKSPATKIENLKQQH
jgi:hypothetical protein